MDQSILTAAQSKAAREFLGLSQNAVSKEVGVNRSQLGLFEVKKYVLPDQTLRALREYYEGQGYPFEEQSRSRARRSNLSEADGELLNSFFVPLDQDGEEAQYILEEIAASEKKIEQKCAENPEVNDWLIFSDPDTEGRDEIIRLMARNYQLVRLMQGYDILAKTDPTSLTNADLVLETLGLTAERDG